MKSQKSLLVSLLAIAMLLLTFGVGLAQGTTVDVTLGMSEFKFDPAELDVAAGAEVTFNVSNTGDFPHNVTFVAPDGTESNLFAENLAGGQNATGKFTFTSAGEWRMYCPVGQHEERGMVGIVRVAAATGDQAAAGATQSGTSQATTTQGAATTGSANPATLPTTGSSNVFAWALAAAVIFVGAGLALRRSVKA